MKQNISLPDFVHKPGTSIMTAGQFAGNSKGKNTKLVNERCVLHYVMML